MDVATVPVSKRARPASLYVKHEFGRSIQPVVSSCQHSQASPPAARSARSRGSFATCRASRAISTIARLARQRSEEHTSELQSRRDLVCRLLLEKKKNKLTAKNSTHLIRY